MYKYPSIPDINTKQRVWERDLKKTTHTDELYGVGIGEGGRGWDHQHKIMPSSFLTYLKDYIQQGMQIRPNDHEAVDQGYVK